MNFDVLGFLSITYKQGKSYHDSKASSNISSMYVLVVILVVLG